MSNTNCTVAWIDGCVLEILLLSLKDYFHKRDMYLWVKQRENNSVLERSWFSAVLSSTSPICKPSSSVTTPSAFFKLSFFIFLDILQYIQRVRLSIGVSLLVALKILLARNLGWLLMVLCHVVIVVYCLKLRKISLIFILPHHTTNLDTTEKITQYECRGCYIERYWEVLYFYCSLKQKVLLLENWEALTACERFFHSLSTV